MQIELTHKFSNTAAKVTLNKNETIVCESGAMIAMNTNISITTTTHKIQKGSFIKSIKRALAGESFFLNHYSSQENNMQIWLSNSLQGDMETVELTGNSIIVQAGGFLFMDSKIEMDMNWQGFKSLFSGESLFWLNLKGNGSVVINSFGRIYCIDVQEEYIVDTSHIVAFDETLSFSISKAGTSFLHSFIGGEGLTCHFSGFGRVWCQSHNQRTYGKLLKPFLKHKSQ
jgi:uncharacterized protein (TIGR00266 family)